MIADINFQNRICSPVIGKTLSEPTCAKMCVGLKHLLAKDVTCKTQILIQRNIFPLSAISAYFYANRFCFNFPGTLPLFQSSFKVLNFFIKSKKEGSRRGWLWVEKDGFEKLQHFEEAAQKVGNLLMGDSDRCLHYLCMMKKLFYHFRYSSSTI